MVPSVTPSIKSSRILVVEDNRGNQQIISAYLTAAGYTNLTFADDGQEGLDKAKEIIPDIILLDIMMPKMDGFEVLARLRKDETLRAIPVLVQTALIKPEDRVRVFKGGATDLISKPINAIEMLSRIAIHLENKALIRSLTNYQSRVEKELHLAQDMQASLLPKPQDLERIKDGLGLFIDGHFEASSEVGGDLWGAEALDEHRLAVSCVDFSGHGVTAALNTFRLHTLMSGLGAEKNDPSACLGVLNQRLVALLPTEQYATMFYGIIDTRTRILTYAAAAPPSPLLGRFGEDPPIPGNPRGLPLGISKVARYENRTLPFAPGAYLFLYSDALTESRDRDGKALGEEGVAELLTRHAKNSAPNDVLKAIIASFLEQVDTPLPDDLTAVYVHWKT